MPQNISYTTIASILLKEINKVRNTPQILIPLLHQRINKYDQLNNYYPLTGLNFSVKTQQGKQGVYQLIKYLQKQRQCPSLQWSYELHQAADKRAHFLSATQDNRNLNRIANLQIGQLVNDFVEWKGSLIELKFYGFIEPREFICELLLQDGHAVKQNRNHFFNRACLRIGLAINTHPTYRFVVVLIMTEQVSKYVPFEVNRRSVNEDGNQRHNELKQVGVSEDSAGGQPTCDIQNCSIY